MNTYLRKLCMLAFSFSLTASVAYAEDASSDSTYLKEGSSYTLVEVTDDSVASDTDMIITDYLTGTTYRVSINGSDDSNLYYYYSWTALDTSTSGSLLTSTEEAPTDYDFKFGYEEDGVYQGNTTPITLDSDNFDTYSDYTFVNNNSTVNSGGAMKITSDLSSSTLSADFIGNTALSVKNTGTGGALYVGTNGNIGYVSGDFIGNAITNTSNYTGGAAIANAGTIGTLSGNFIENIAMNGGSKAQGGAVFNVGTIGDITANFYSNYSSGTGGAVYNQTNGSITGSISGTYSGNSAANGGAIYSVTTIGDENAETVISAKFYGNSATGAGGAFFQTAAGYLYSDITGVFTSNTAGTTGGAIHNVGTISGNISADFTSNTASSYGGAIYNAAGTINGGIAGSFTTNGLSSVATVTEATTTTDEVAADPDNDVEYAAATSTLTTTTVDNFIDADYGGAISNTGTISGGISASFTGNIATTGGAIHNASGATITGDISGDFTGNGTYTTTTTTVAVTTTDGVDETSTSTSSVDTVLQTTNGGAIYNVGTIDGNITGAFDSNIATTSGGAIFNSGTITGSITGDFTDNQATTSSSGGAIYNSGTIGTEGVDTVISSDFIDNFAGTGGAIYNSGTIYSNITSDFTSNSISGNSTAGGTFYNTSTGNIYGDITGNFVANYVTATFAAGIALTNAGTIHGEISSTFIGNYSTSNNTGSVVYNTGSIESISGDFIGNSSKNVTGGIYNSGTITVSGNFIGNSASAINTSASFAYANPSGAIYNVATMTIETAGSDIQFTGNTGFSSTTSASLSNAINNSGTIYINAYGDNTVTFNDGVLGAYAAENETNSAIYINGTETDTATSYSTVSINNTVSTEAITVSNGTLELGSYAGTSNLYESYYGSNYLTVLEKLYEDYDYEAAGSTSLASYISTTYGTGVSVAASSAGFTSSTLNIGTNATLSLKVSTSDATAANSIVFNNTTITIESGAQAALDLSEIYGNFTLTLTFSEYDNTDAITAMYTFLSSDLDVIFAEYTIEDVVGSEGSFAVTDGEGNSLADFTITNENNIITIDGESYVVVVPEPSTYAMIIGLFALAFAYYRRRK